MFSLYVVRHGLTTANKEGVLQGQMDTPLHEIGIQGAISTGERLKDVKFSHAYSSDLSR